MAAPDRPQPDTFRNPLLDDGADPWMVWHDGYYYLTATESHCISMRKARSIADLHNAAPQCVWSDDTPGRRREMWAQEFYLLDGPNGRRWYMYYTASEGGDPTHRMHVLEGQGDTPMGPYTYKAQLRTDPDNALYAIDGGLIQTGDGSTYCVWAGWPNHRLFISRMENPWTLCGDRVRLHASGFGCDEVREGPVALRRNDKIFLFYSACDTGKPDYKLGMLVADEGADLMDAASWKQHPEPMLTRCDAHGIYGPGHNSFFHSPDGRETWILYHAKATSAYTYKGRKPHAQRVQWLPSGYPFIGEPLPLDAAIPVPSGDPGAATGA